MRILIRSILRALFLDVPYLIDSAWRRLDFAVNSEFRYRPAALGRPAALERRPCWELPIFWFFALTVAFIAYGPVWDGLCTVIAPPASAWALGAAGTVLMLAAGGWLIFIAWPASGRGIESRLGRSGSAALAENPVALRWRRVITAVVVYGFPVVPFLLLVAGGVWLIDLARSAPGPCAGAELSYLSVARLLLAAAAIAAFGAACSRVQSTSRLLWIQGALVGGLALLHWLLLAPPEATAVSGQPYRHFFALAAPALCLAICLAPAAAAARFRPPAWLQRWGRFAGLKDQARRRFAERLPQAELFVPRGADPELTFDRVIHALVHGTLYRPLQLLLPPSLLAFVAPPNWLAPLAAAGFAFSILMLTWGSIASRWQQMVLHVERWFMSGTSLPVSVVVIVIAALRVLEVDYVSTILDAAPFGVLFGAMVMSYVLSWLVEYWINRVAAGELLRVLGDADDGAVMPYPRAAAPDPPVRVEQHGRFLMSHAIGRFLVVGTVSGEPDRPAGAAFHTYDLTGLFRAVAGRDDRHVAEIDRHTALYFYVVNAILLAVAVGFVLWHAASSWKPSSVDAVVQARAAVPADGLDDLAARLVSPPGVRPRPALVVVASGGGTRAALYTAHALEGLRRLGAERDIVLLSGVSGGGVALAYFAANHDKLAAPGATAAEWDDFKRKIAGPFIQDVLEGATEWRVFGPSPLTVLLAESFERRLPGAAKRFGELPAGAPALVLNTTVVGHPAEESDVLRKTLDEAGVRSAADCAERERPFTLMNGGRLIFTNLGNTSAFPPRESRIPDTRLPYRIVQDPDVTLASAAALNANFPPVFPNARVVLKDVDKGAPCPHRSFFVTDGGAEENLGLVSALYAVRSALEDLRRRCDAAQQPEGRRAPGCPGALRPIHFVIAEASAASFDYHQDRGVSAAVSGAKERMTGGLTDALIESSEALYRQLAGPDAGVRELRFHYLALPLAFRARGGFGTHWMHAETIKLTDPRRRTPPRFRGAGSDIVSGTVTLDKEDIRALWSDLHVPDTPFCGVRDSESAARATVRGWICGGPGAPGPRDGHIEEWARLVAALK